MNHPSTPIAAFNHALRIFLLIVALLLITSSLACAQNKSVESYPNIHNAPIRLRLLDGPHGREIIGARLTLTGGYDERDLKLKMWRAEIKTDDHGEATLPRMIANLPLLTVKGAHLSTCEGQPKQGYYSIEEIRSQGLSTINGCGASGSDSQPGLFTLIVERKDKNSKIEKKQEINTLKVDAQKNHQKIYPTNGKLAPAESAPTNNALTASTNSIDPAQLNFTAPPSPLQQPTPIAHSDSSNPLKHALFALNSKPTLITAHNASAPPHEAAPEPITNLAPSATTAPFSLHPLLSTMSMANGIVAGAQIHASLHKSPPVHHAVKIAATKTAPQQKSEAKPQPATANPQIAAAQKPQPTSAAQPTKPAPSQAKPTPPQTKPTPPPPAVTPAPQSKPQAGK